MLRQIKPQALLLVVFQIPIPKVSALYPYCDVPTIPVVKAFGILKRAAAEVNKDYGLEWCGKLDLERRET